MSGVHRLLSRREKKKPAPSPTTSPDHSALPHSHGSHSQTVQIPSYFGDIFTSQEDRPKKVDKETERKVKGISERLRQHGIDSISDANIQYALRTKSIDGDGDAAYRLVMTLQETYEGLVRPYQPDTKLLGAENRQAVTCYLDALLFAMFARLDSFEALLYDSFEDAPRRRLAGLLRLWVNMLRGGQLITVDVTKNIQDALAACGWQDAAQVRQQDPSEAFTFITDKLELPLLTLKMDLYHTGKEDPQDDHKFVNERLLEVAILDEPLDGNKTITLEDCLEHYFNNRIEVKRHLENQRRNTLKSSLSGSWSSKIFDEKSSASHIEVLEVDSPYTPLAESPISDGTLTNGMVVKGPVDRIRPTNGRKRADSIFSQRKVQLDSDVEKSVEPTDESNNDGKGRKMSTRTEVLMPAWQFFKLLPWYTDHLPESDAQVAAHFSRKRPVLGICLKRYAFTRDGQATRKGTFIDIPLEIAVPNFVSDDSMQEDGPLVGHFRLMLQAVVCHRGMSVHSGHYICLCRGTASNARSRPETCVTAVDAVDLDEVEDPWMRFDDLAKDRITYVDIHQALREETPYLLFYQVQPVDESGRSLHDLPTYAEAVSRTHSAGHIFEKQPVDQSSEHAPSVSNTSPQIRAMSPAPARHTNIASPRTSLDVSDAIRGRMRSSFGEERRASVSFDENVTSAAGSVRTEATNSVPSTPSEEKQSGFLAVANKMTSRRGSRQAKIDSHPRSRRPSTDVDVGSAKDITSPRFSLRDLNMTKLTQRMSRANETGPTLQATTPQDAVPSMMEDADAPAYSEVDLQRTPTNETALATTNPLGQKDSSESTASAKLTGALNALKGKDAQRFEHKRSRKPAEDRECIVM